MTRYDCGWPDMTGVAGVSQCDLGGRKWPRVTGVAVGDQGSRSHG